MAYLAQIRRMSDFLLRQVGDVPEELLYRRPGPSLNPIGWIYWHLLRIWDLDLNWIIRGQDPAQDAWNRGGFSARSGYDPTGKGFRIQGTGFGYTDTEVDEVRIARPILDDYLRQLLTETSLYLNDADEAELHRSFDSPIPPGETTTPAERIQHTIGQCWNHIGEIRYIKGMFGYFDGSYPGPGDR
jgi:hypothetical protein